jgi:NADPH-dependent 2,4-dienoyl-CoA reductase/sulfur reductase-like enzyme/rhodanese-related sulfurtransferase
MKIVIIGGVAAGLKAASKAKRCNPHAEITVVEKGDLISYGACGLPYYVGAEVNEVNDLMRTPAGVLRTPEYFQSVKDIQVLPRTLATGIDRERKSVSVKNLDTGEEAVLLYDKLVIATGAYPIKPDLPGAQLTNIFQFWHPHEAKRIRQGLERGSFSNVVIIGAGLVGMEMASALTVWGVNITVIERQEHIFPAFLDAEIAGNAEKYLQGEGIQLFTGEKVIRFVGDAVVTAVETDKRTVAADLVILALGVRPNAQLAEAAGLKLGITGAIAVDEKLQTSDTDIYAGGDCVENTNIVSGQKVFAPMGSLANRHGRIIGENLCGAERQFRGVLNTVIVKVLDMNVGKTGITEREAKELGYDYVTVITAGHDKPHYMEDAKIIAIKLIADVKTRKILGVQACGQGEIAKRIDVVAALLTVGGTIDDVTDIDLSYAPPYNSPIDNLAVAANSLMNKLAGKMKGLSPLQAKELLQNNKVVFLDVRTTAEYKQERLADCQNIKHIPLGELRSRYKELNPNDEIVTFCKISLRGYEAEGILEGQEFKNVKVLEGGIFSWPFECEK